MPFIDADDLHTPEAIAKMTRGEALDDADRWPWLARVRRAAECIPASETGPSAVIACSALRRSYRDALRASDTDVLRVVFVFLTASADTLQQRLAARQGHFMGQQMLASQLATLEPPCNEADVLTLDVSPSMHVDDMVRSLREKLH